MLYWQNFIVGSCAIIVVCWLLNVHYSGTMCNTHTYSSFTGFISPIDLIDFDVVTLVLNVELILCNVF